MLSIQEIESTPIVFIISNGRSGSTLLRVILDGSSETSFPPESKFIIHLKQKYQYVPVWTQKLVNRLIVDLYKDVKFRHVWRIKPTELKTILSRYKPEDLTFQIICKIIYLSYSSPFQKTHVKVIGDKNPAYSMFLPELLSVFPDARFIHLIRDYRASIVSNRKLFKRKNIAGLAYVWKTYNQLAEQLKQTDPGNVYTLRYEDLVSDPKRYTAEVCHFIGVSFNENMLDFYKKAAEYQDQINGIRVRNMHPNILKPIHTDNINKWRTELCGQDLAMADDIAQSYASAYGYLPENNMCKPHWFKKIFGWLLCRKDFFIVKGYYKCPFFIRDMARRFSLLNYKLFKIKTLYNEGDLSMEYKDR